MSWRENLNVNQLTLGSNMVNQSDGPQGVVMTVGTQAADVITVACQFNDANGKALEVPGALSWYLADDAAGLTPTAAAPDVGTAAGTDGAIIENVANVAGVAVSEVDGDVDIAIEDATGTPTWYLVFILPTGKLAISDAITFA